MFFCHYLKCVERSDLKQDLDQKLVSIYFRKWGYEWIILGLELHVIFKSINYQVH